MPYMLNTEIELGAFDIPFLRLFSEGVLNGKAL